MLSRDALFEASRKGLIDETQVTPLYEFLLEADSREVETADPEEMHFAKGFHDIFVSIGLGILFTGYFVGLGFLIEGSPVGPIGMYFGAAVLCWLLAEWFSRKLRLSLPSILLTGGFMLSFWFGAVNLVGFVVKGNAGDWWSMTSGSDLSAHGIAASIPFVLTLLAGWAFYKRFAVPITPAFMAMAAGMLCFLVLAILDEDLLGNLLNIWLFLVGLACFGLALFFDRKDPLRKGLNSDKAFWLHLVAAPMIVHSVLSLVAAVDKNAIAAFVTIGLVVLIALIALVIDRRALLASAISYLGVAIGVLLATINLGEATAISLTLLLLGAFVLMLGSGWTSLRRKLLRPYASHAFMHKLPPVSPER
ncbi:hypothetical protein [uncultured Cohaesibacter sp.]|uniref:hypothetical protein n=1 Tax=uncultured Cohaesibacter sp. TaxID=1002546 RepID=UPI0029C6D308|nr:hypothetical protein [uncultured Cohaesibacter sp.]